MLGSHPGRQGGGTTSSDINCAHLTVAWWAKQWVSNRVIPSRWLCTSSKLFSNGPSNRLGSAWREKP